MGIKLGVSRMRMPSFGVKKSDTLPLPTVRTERKGWCLCRRQTILVFLFFTLLLVAPTVYFQREVILPKNNPVTQRPKIPKPNALSEDRLEAIPLELIEHQTARMQLLLPVAQKSGINICKTLMTASVLGYPVPELISYNHTSHGEDLLGGGSHVGKIKGVLDFLKRQPEERKDDMVVVLDPYGGFNYEKYEAGKTEHALGDIWLQLRPDTLLSRFYAVNNLAYKSMVNRLGDAVKEEQLRQSIIFGAGKQCAPNDPHSIACYAVPESPLPWMYSSHTDNLVPDGMGNYTTHRPRFLNSGFIMGPTSDMTRLFQRAQDKVVAIRKDPAAMKKFRGSDQYIFQEIFGEQEYQRELMRRRHSSTWSIGLNAWKDDVLNPSFPHDSMEEKEGKPDEFSMGVDYWSDITHQTANSPLDSQWITYNRPVPPQAAIETSSPYRCTSRVTGNLPFDIINSTIPRTAVSDASQFAPFHGWNEIPLYTDVCLDSIPVMVQHTGSRQEREEAWPKMWIQIHGRRLVEEVLARGGGETGTLGGAYAGNRYLHWEKLCPTSFEGELYREYDDSL